MVQSIYDKELKLLISSWRNLFLNENLPFVIIQINDYEYRDDDGWHMVQKAQEKVVNETSNTILVKANDYCINEKQFIHPPYKKQLSYSVADKILNYIEKKF